MRNTLRCPKCDGREVLHVTRIQDKDQVGDGAVLSIQSVRPGWAFGRHENSGVLEAYVCAACGFTELYTKDVGQLVVDGEIIRRLTAPESPPYR